jgi:hypothetical protein
MRRAARSGSVITLLALAAATLPAGAGAATLHVSPKQVSPGAKTRVFGSAAGGCAAGDRVTLISRAFPGTHRFAGVPAISAATSASGRFSKRVRIPRGRAPGSYTVTGRCGGGNLGVTRRLRVLAPGLTARRIAIGDHAAFVRTVVRFNGGTLGATDAEASDPAPFDGVGRMVVRHAGIGTTAPAARRQGVRVTVTQGTGRLRIHLGAAHRRFKYLAYRRLHGPERLVVDLYKSAPPTPAAERPGTSASCLSIAEHADTGGSIQASGTARGIFENQFTLAVRNAAGRVVGHRNVAFGGTAPNWTSRVSYTVNADQPGTLEAVDLSARDGALSCLAQIRVPLAAPLKAPPF